MNLTITFALATAAILAGIGALGAAADQDRVAFPDRHADGARYAIVDRGNLRQEIFANREAIEAVKRGLPIPSGTVITLVEYRARRDDRGNAVRDSDGHLSRGELSRYVVMEKRTGWGDRHPPEKRNGDWEFQAFRADRSVNRDESLDRCFFCHKGRGDQDFVFTLDRMRSFP